MRPSVFRHLFMSAALLGILVAPTAAQQPGPVPKPPPDRKMACDETAKAHQLTGSARSSFMADCLGATAGTTASPPDKTRACTAKADAQKLVGDARNLFMRRCLEAS